MTTENPSAATVHWRIASTVGTRPVAVPRSITTGLNYAAMARLWKGFMALTPGAAAIQLSTANPTPAAVGLSTTEPLRYAAVEQSGIAFSGRIRVAVIRSCTTAERIVAAMECCIAPLPDLMAAAAATSIATRSRSAVATVLALHLLGLHFHLPQADSFQKLLKDDSAEPRRVSSRSSLLISYHLYSFRSS